VIYVGLPAYNEEASIGLVIAQTLKALGRTGLEFRILVYNDGSRDRTLEIARAWEARFPDRVEVLDGGVNKGLGVAVRSLFEAVISRTSDRLALERPPSDSPDGVLDYVAADNEDALVILDADCTQTPEMIWPMVQRIHRGYDLIIASRYRAEARVVGVTRLRRFLSWGASLMMRTLFPFEGVRDYTTGFRCYSARTLGRLKAHYGDEIVSETGFACMSEVLLKIRRLGAVAAEVPLVLRYDAKPSPSKMQVGKTVRQVFRVMGRWGFGR